MDRRELLATLYREGIRLEVTGQGNIRIEPAEHATEELKKAIRAHSDWLVEQLRNPYDHDWVLDATYQILGRAAKALGDRPLPDEAARALDAVDQYACQENRFGVLCALATFEQSILDMDSQPNAKK